MTKPPKIYIKNPFLSFYFKVHAFIKSYKPIASKEINWDDRFSQLGSYGVIDTRHPLREFSYVTERQKKIIFPLFKSQLLGTEKNILDFGCGPGRFTFDLAAIIKGQAIGVDVTKGYIHLARDQLNDINKKNVKFIHSRSFLNSNKVKFDIIWICLVLGGISDINMAEISKKISRNLNTNGLLFIIESTSKKNKKGLWNTRTVSEVIGFFNGVNLKRISLYIDANQEISIFAGRKY